MAISRRRVLLVLGWYDHRLVRGIEKFAQEQGWRLSQDLAREKVIPWGWEGDGILAWLGAGDDLAEFVRRAALPTVDFSNRRPRLPFARVLEDHSHAGRLVANHFLSRGFRHYAFFTDADNWAYGERRDGFEAALRESGKSVHVLDFQSAPERRPGKNEWRSKREWLTARLLELPKPVALFAAADGLALEVLECCESAGIAVPGDVALVGAGNSLLAVDTMRTPISSVDTNMELLGYEGAALLAKLMTGAPTPTTPMRVAPLGLLTRKSSDRVAVSHPKVARCMRYLIENCHEPIDVGDLAKVAGMSRRGLHQAFMEYIGSPPGAELHRARIENAKILLVESDDKIESIAHRCGYSRANSFTQAFKQDMGMSPQRYRATLRKSR